MTVKFVEYRGTYMNQCEQDKIMYILSSLGEMNSYFCNLQLIYNNPIHFQTISASLCDMNLLQEIAYNAQTGDCEIVVQGVVHENFHMSGMIYDMGGMCLSVYDTYIRVLYKGNLLHILVEPPRLVKNQMYYIDISMLTNQCTMMIPLQPI